jgi:hypothetical protein
LRRHVHVELAGGVIRALIASGEALVDLEQVEGAV